MSALGLAQRSTTKSNAQSVFLFVLRKHFTNITRLKIKSPRFPLLHLFMMCLVGFFFLALFTLERIVLFRQEKNLSRDIDYIDANLSSSPVSVVMRL